MKIRTDNLRELIKCQSKLRRASTTCTNLQINVVRKKQKLLQQYENSIKALPCSAFSFQEKDYVMQPCSKLTLCGHHETALKTARVCGP